MSIYEYDEEKHMRQVREEGIEIGIEKGIQQILMAGGERLGRLGELLMDSERKENLFRAILNEEYREQLYEEFQIK